jgi:hypothetical protein
LIGTYAVAQLLVIDPRYVFVTCAIISGIGIATTFFLTEETKGVPLTEYEVDEDRGIPLPTEDSPFIQHSTNA